MSNPTKIFLVEDHTILRESLGRVIEGESDLKLVGSCGEGREALIQMEQDRPDLAILDIMLPGMSGVEIIRQLRITSKTIKIIVLSQYDRREFVHEAFSLGANAYVLKQDATDDLIRAVREVMSSHMYISPRLTRSFVDGHFNLGENDSLLSPRELEILKLIAEGHSNVEIGHLLFIAPTTVKTHRAHIMKKLDAKRVTHLVKYAVKSGLVEF